MSGIGRSLGCLSRRLRILTGWTGSELEAFQLHLEALGLLGIRFTLRQYTEALTAYWAVTTKVLNYPDQREPILQSQVLEEGSLGATRRRRPGHPIIIEVRESLMLRPWPIYELVAFHELMHHVCEHKSRSSISHSEHEAQEEQARRWANWAVLASSEPKLFSREATETIT